MILIRTIYSEFLKLITSRVWLIILGLVLIFQPLLGILEAKQLIFIGLDATPETHPELLEAIPPLDYFGFDSAVFGLLPIVIWAGVNGASEYKYHSLRTSMLCTNKRIILFVAKLLTVLISTILVSFSSIFITVSITHFGLGSLGLHPLALSSLAWRFVWYTTIYWVLLTTLSFFIGLFFRSMIIPLLFLIPQIYNFGNYIAEKWDWGKYFPVAAGNLIIATPVKSSVHDPVKGILILCLWILFTMVIALYSFIHSDVGGKY